jgi:endoglucanase
MTQLNNLFLVLCLSLFTIGCEKPEHTPDPEPIETSLTVSPDSLVFESTGGQQAISITSNAVWRLEFAGISWVRPTIQTSQGNATINIIADPNPDTTQRVALFKLSAQGATDITISIKQAGKSPDPVEPARPDYIDPDNTGMRDLTSFEFAKLMKLGWNLGNSLEAISVNNGIYSGSETTWGNPMVNKQLIDSVKAAGFNTIRIPVSWSHKLDDKQPFKISEAWKNRVEEVVNYALDNDMIVKINIHWDGSWMNQPTYNQQETINTRLAALWKQIAIHFRDYDDRLLFAGTNEVHVAGNYGTPSQENANVQNSFNQTFVNTVRATGGRNAYRHLVVQSYNTNIEHAINFFVMPQDNIEKRLMAEVHFYDPFDFTLQESGKFATQWGQPFAGGDVSNWGQEKWVDDTFDKVKNHFINNGIPVLLGEYAAMLRLTLVGEALQKHIESRNYYLEYVTRAAVERGMVPYYWDSGHTGNNASGLFNRSNGAVVHTDALEAIIKAAKE